MARSTSTVYVKEKVMREERAGTAPSQHRQGDFFWTFVTQGWALVNLLAMTHGGWAWFALQVRKQRSFSAAAPSRVPQRVCKPFNLSTPPPGMGRQG